MIADFDVVKTEVKRLSSKPKWPFEQEGQLELARIALKYSTDIQHLRETIAEISEHWDHCPDGRELSQALAPSSSLPTFTGKRTSCPRGQCDGSGWIVIEVADTTAAMACECRKAKVGAA